ncbi:hypothetical protein ACFX1X_013199 [Malus domestica]
MGLKESETKTEWFREYPEPIAFRNPFTYPHISDTKRIFTSIVSATKLDLRVQNAVLQSYASISTVNDSIFLFSHMIKTHHAFSHDTQ